MKLQKFAGYYVSECESTSTSTFIFMSPCHNGE